MRSLIWLARIAAILSTSQAFQSILIGDSYNVTAGSDVPVTIVNDAHDETAVNYTVGLYNSAGNSLICTLIDTLPISTKQFSVSIPSSVGPSGFYYALYLISYSSSGSVVFPFPSYSNSFYLSSGNGTLTSYEVLGPVPNQFFAQGFYAAYSPPCSSYDCWRQCAKHDPPVFQDNGQGLAQAGQTLYDERYIECLEACPGVKNPLPTDVNDVATTTTGTGPLPTSTSSLVADVLPSKSCDVDGGETFCGNECCAVGVKCFYWNQCSQETVSLGSSPSATASSASATKSANASKTTGGTPGTTGKSLAWQLRYPSAAIIPIALLHVIFNI